MEMTKEQIEKVLREKFEELERPVSQEDLLGSKISLNECFELLDKDDFFLIHSFEFDNESYGTPSIIFYFPKEEKEKLIKKIIKIVIINQKDYGPKDVFVKDIKKIGSKELLSMVEKYFLEFYNILYLKPELVNKKFLLDLFTSNKIYDPRKYFIDHILSSLDKQEGIINITKKSEGIWEEELKTKFNKGAEERDKAYNYSKYSKINLEGFHNFIIKKCGDILNYNISKNSDELVVFDKFERKKILKSLLYKFFIENRIERKIEDIVYDLGLENLPEQIVKPISQKEIRAIVSNDEYFNYNPETDTVNLCSFKEIFDKIKNYFDNNYSSFLSNETELYNPGIFAVRFIGKEFPLSEANEYVKMRPIIYVNYFLGGGPITVKELFLSEIEESGLFTPELEYLKSLFTSFAEYVNWMKNNASFSFYEMDFYLVWATREKIISELSPIFNIQHNPGNLFQYTLKSKLEEYLKKQNL